MKIDLIEQNDIFDFLCDEINSNKNEFILYGWGEYAKALYPRFLENNVTIDYIVGDKAYIKNAEFYGKDVKAIDEILKSTAQCDLWVGFGAWRDYEYDLKNWRRLLEEHLRYWGGVNKIYFYDCYTKFTYRYVKDNWAAFLQTYQWLCDEKSKNIMEAFINQRISGRMDLIEIYSENNQYIPEDLILFKENDVLIDCGAYTGDTVYAFIEKLKMSGIEEYFIYAIEPNPGNVLRMKSQFEGMTRVAVLEKGTWSKKMHVGYEGDTLLGGHVVEHEDVNSSLIEVDTIDNILSGGKVDFIKMDIEGSELESLHGAERSIRTYKPNMAICVYHKQEDLITIPQYIKSLDDKYNLYLRAHGGDSSEVVLYALYNK